MDINGDIKCRYYMENNYCTLIQLVSEGLEVSKQTKEDQEKILLMLKTLSDKDKKEILSEIERRASSSPQRTSVQSCLQ